MDVNPCEMGEDARRLLISSFYLNSSRDCVLDGCYVRDYFSK